MVLARILVFICLLVLETKQGDAALSVIISPAADVTAIKFKFVYISCQVESSHPYNITWLRDNVVLTRKPPPFIVDWSKGGSLMVRPLFLTFSGLYECVVQNGIDPSVKKGLRITVKEKSDIPAGFPRLTKISQRTYVDQFETIRLVCAFAGSPQPSLKWFFRRLPVDTSSSRIAVLADNTLEIKNASMDDVGFYECEGLNIYGIDYSGEIQTFVRPYIAPTLPPIPPRFDMTPQDTIANPETDVTITCNATGYPPPVYRWYRNGNMMDGGTNGIQVVRYIVDSGNFTCQAVNIIGSITSDCVITVRPIPLTPRDPQFVSRSPDSITIEWEDSVIERYPITRYIVKYRRRGTQAWTSKIIPFSDVKQFTLDGIGIFQFYNFQVFSANTVGISFGSGVKTFYSAETIPSTPARKLLAWGLSDTTANVTWIPPLVTNGRLAGYRVYYTTDETLPFRYWYKFVTPFLNGQLRRLQPQAVYFYKIQVFSLRGNGPFTNVSVFKAQKGVPGQIEGLTALPASPSSVRLDWNVPLYKGDGLDGYVIIYNDTATTKRSLEIDTVTESGVVQHLRPYTVYSFKVVARSFSGLGPESRPIEVRTMEDIPSAPPANVRGFPKSSTSLEVLWEPPPSEHRNGPMVGYNILYTETPSASPSIKPVNASQTTVLLTGLKKYTKYTIWVVARNSLGSGPPSSKFEIFTNEDVPEGAPRQVRVEALNSSAFSVSWLEPVEKSGRILGYMVYYVPMTDDHKLIPFETTTRKYNAQGAGIRFAIVRAFVQPLQTYRVQVAAYSVVGEGARSPYMYIKTPKVKPPPPRITIIVADETRPDILIKWRPRIANVVRYNVVYGKSLRQYDSLTDVKSRTFPGTVRHEMFGNLSYGVWYCFKISESTADDTSADSTHWVLTPDGAPTGWPERVGAVTESSSSIKVSWYSPDPWKESGPIMNYRVRYKKAGDRYRYAIHDGTSATTMIKLVTQLQANTEYIVAVQAFTTVGGGPFSRSVRTKTSNEVLPVVENLAVSEVSSSTAFVRWKAPAVPPHIRLWKYKVTYRGSKSYKDETGTLQTLYKEGTTDVDSTSYELQGLHASLRYQVEIIAVTSAGNGDRELVTFTTDNEPPSSVPTPKLQKLSAGSKEVMINISPASEINGPIEYYLLFVLNLGTDKSQVKQLLRKQPSDYNIGVRARRATDGGTRLHVARQFNKAALPTRFKIGDGTGDSQYTNSKLDVGCYYVFFVRAFVGQGGGQNGYVKASSEFSEVVFYASDGVTTLGQRGTPGEPGGTASDDSGGGGMAWIAGVAVGLLVIVLLVVLLVVYARRRRRRRGDPEEKKPLRRSSSKNKPRDLVQLHRLTNQTPGIINHPPISLAAFEQHCTMLKDNENAKFVKEFESIDIGRSFTSDASAEQLNRAKNRYPNVVAYDHTRVKLQFKGELGSDYINANFIDGYCRERAYVATQGPMSNTVDDFWRACWEQNTASIVMMTELEERGRGKCEQYWPSSGSATFGNIKVGLKESLELCYYTIRTLEVADIDSNLVREIKHFQFTAWPEIGVPLDEGPLLSFIRCVRSSTPPTAGPIVVHCSAGVGRTACFIVIHSMLERIAHDNTIDIYGYVAMLRTQRNFTMQSEEQYMFVHDALLEAIHSDTEIPQTSLLHHFKRLMDLTKVAGGRLIDDEFADIVSRTNPDPCNCLTAQITSNMEKNRCETIVPYDSNRVCLEQKPGQEIADYVNASFIDGYRSRHAYIVAQGPMSSTVDDFWRMVVEQNCSVIVMLTRLCDKENEDLCCKYWPTEKTVHYHFYVIEPVSETRQANFVIREFKVKDARDGSLRTVRQFHFTSWPKGGVPLATGGVIELIGQMQDAQNQLCSGGPVLIHSSTGVGRSGVFVALSIALERLRVESRVDMCQTVKSLRRQRPYMVQTVAQYQFCYQTVVDFLRSFDYIA